MKMAEVKDKAKKLGLKTAKLGKQDLIKIIQCAEGNSPCFGTAGGFCAQGDCCWRQECLPRERKV